MYAAIYAISAFIKYKRTNIKQTYHYIYLLMRWFEVCICRARFVLKYGVFSFTLARVYVYFYISLNFIQTQQSVCLPNEVTAIHLKVGSWLLRVY